MIFLLWYDTSGGSVIIALSCSCIYSWESSLGQATPGDIVLQRAVFPYVHSCFFIVVTLFYQQIWPLERRFSTTLTGYSSICMSKRFCSSWSLLSASPTSQLYTLSTIHCLEVARLGKDPSRCAFLETPETFWVHFGWHNFLHILKAKAFPGMKFCNKFALSYLEIIVNDQLCRVSGSQF